MNNQNWSKRMETFKSFLKRKYVLYTVIIIVGYFISYYLNRPGFLWLGIAVVIYLVYRRRSIKNKQENPESVNNTESICPHCKESVNPQAVKCPHCQSKIYRWTKGRLILLGFFAFAMIAMIISINSDSSPRRVPVQKEKHDDITVCTEAQMLIEQSLKSPSTAKFPSCRSTNIQRLPNDTFIVSAYVDSQNGFGAMLRTDWTIKYSYIENGSKTLTEYLIIDGKKVFDSTIK